MVASSQDGLQEVDKALAGTHLLAANLQHLQLLPHLPPQTVRRQSDVRYTMPKTDCCRWLLQPEGPEGLLGQSDAEGDSPLQCGGLSSHTVQKAHNSFVPVVKIGYTVWWLNIHLGCSATRF